MDSLFVEEVAASLVREFLSRKGLKKTCVTMDQERPRSDLSINSRNNLRKVLHLEFLYKENKAKENPLKTSLELITRYFLDHFGNTANSFTQETPMPALSLPKKSNKLPLRCSEATLVNIYDLADEDAAWRTSLSETSKARHDHLDGDILGNFVSSKRPPHKSKPVPTVPAESPAVAPVWEKKDRLQPSEPSLDTKRVGEKFRTKSGLIVRDLMAGPTASCPQVVAPSCFVRVESVSLPGSPLGQLSEPPAEKHRPLTGTPSHLPSPGLLQGSGRWRGLSEDSPAADGGPEADGTPLKFSLPGGSARATQERLERTFKRQGNQCLPLR
ncbi:Protein FAM188B [Myotis brandtii]|uniref:Ubiquitin carboxyl-terminal hydrolase MINDY n=1 Tax=Myotis brandtii TaxID=109478 RepID=S7PCT2_MYOBR|nr:Protein FAM188B [Myotis brandtii]